VSRHPSHAPPPYAQRVAQKLFSAIERFLHVEAVGGAVLLLAAAAALAWANSPVAATYHGFWDTPVTIGIGDFALTGTAHYVVNEVLMTIFFLVVGMEIRRELHDGALSNPRAAALPLAAALGGIVLPAVLYLALNGDPEVRAGWAIPTATDIAFAVGVLALLGRSIPGAVRVLLLALAIVDDVAAVLIIAVFYSGGLHYPGLLLAVSGVLLVLALQRIGVGAAYAYVLPGALVWLGLQETGVHPTLAGVTLGLLTPARPMRSVATSLDGAIRDLKDLASRSAVPTCSGLRANEEAYRRLTETQRELLPPLVRVQSVLHPWVAFGVMPLFALANAGVNVAGLDLDAAAPAGVLAGVTIALVLGKPVGILAASWLAVRLGCCALPPNTNWADVALVGCLGGIGFTMSIFIAGLAFDEGALLAAAKAGVLLASATAGLTGLVIGRLWVARVERTPVPAAEEAALRDAPPSQNY
jgi:NhaA family Na+:H+ antiporter